MCVCVSGYVCPLHGRLCSATLTFLSFCSSQLYEHCRVPAHIWSTLLRCKGTVLLLCLFFLYTHARTTHIFLFTVDLKAGGLGFGDMMELKAICTWCFCLCLSFSFSFSIKPTHRHNLSWSVFCSVFQDKQGIPWWLGLSYKGIFQYDHQDKVKPRKVRWCSLCCLWTTSPTVLCTAFSPSFN